MTFNSQALSRDGGRSGRAGGDAVVSSLARCDMLAKLQRTSIPEKGRIIPGRRTSPQTSHAEKGSTRGTELGAFLRVRRYQAGLADLPPVLAGRRRTSGLRREEVAATAGVSVDYYTRLEQGRERNRAAQSSARWQRSSTSTMTQPIISSSSATPLSRALKSPITPIGTN